MYHVHCTLSVLYILLLCMLARSQRGPLNLIAPTYYELKHEIQICKYFWYKPFENKAQTLHHNYVHAKISPQTCAHNDVQNAMVKKRTQQRVWRKKGVDSKGECGKWSVKPLLVFAPLVLLADLLLFLRSEVVLDVELFANFLGCLALNHVSHCLAGQVQHGLDVKIVCCKNHFEQGTLVNLAELMIPRLNVLALLLLVLLIFRRRLVILVVLAVFNNFGKNGSSNVGKGNGTTIIVKNSVIQHVLQGHRHLGHININNKLLAVGACKSHLLGLSFRHFCWLFRFEVGDRFVSTATPMYSALIP
eukprot:Colp12_sorted_trinity150504_noHs@2857